MGMKEIVLLPRLKSVGKGISKGARPGSRILFTMRIVGNWSLSRLSLVEKKED